jgi:ribosomal protein S18 acetylase RimI-like enzyme
VIQQAKAEAAPALIRAMQPQDLAPVLHLTQLIAEAPSWSLEDFRKLVSSHTPLENGGLTRVAWVAERNSVVLGLVVVQCLRLPSDPTLPPECELESILVHPESRRQGLGEQLLATAIAWCFRENASIIRLEVRAANQAAIRLYEKGRFKRTGKRPRYYTHPEEDALLMQRSLIAGGN